MGHMPKNSSLPRVLPRKLKDIWLNNTPQYDSFEDATWTKQTFPQLAEELEQMAWGQVVAQSHDTSINVIGRAHPNPILDTQLNQVEFAASDVTE